MGIQGYTESLLDYHGILVWIEHCAINTGIQGYTESLLEYYGILVWIEHRVIIS